ncbi:MAG: DinB family protein [Spirochaetes bacterium]|nr:DinB family protein [Spirochaetota bacterium]MBU1081973.1 DinB family protein [Spirochaetota bacterium]
MREVLERMAEYNGKAMAAMLEAVARAPAGLSGKDVGLFYKSVDGTVEHMAWALVLWLKRYAGFGSYPCLEASALVSRPMEDIRAKASGDKAEAEALLREASALVARFVKEMPESDFPRRVSYKTTDGKELERTYWHTIFQVLNHGTHHRGEISAILDMHGVANDYNSFVAYMP